MKLIKLRCFTVQVHPAPLSFISRVKQLPIQVSYLINLLIGLIFVFLTKCIDHSIMTFVSILGLLSELGL